VTNLLWFRNDLRVQDNTSLHKAMQEGRAVIGVYCFDPKQFEKDQWDFKKTERYRAQFLIETITALRENLSRLNIPLFVYYNTPEEVIPELAATYDINKIYCQKEWTPEENTVTKKLKANTNLAWIESYDQFLFHPDAIPFERFDDIPKVFTQFRKKCEKQSRVQSVLLTLQPQEENKDLINNTEIPTLQDLGLEDFSKDSRSAFLWSGGEDAASERLDHYFWKTQKLAYYKKTRNGLVGTDYSSKFSPWLVNGSISARQIYWEVKRFEKEVKKNQDTYWLIFELIWRDYFKYVSLKHGIVNANMIELKETGWMSNRGRQNVASYWAKELNQDWRIGAAYFESMLLDYDVHSNYGNWMYNAGVGNDPRDRKFNIKRQADMYDSSGKFVKLWLQETLF